MKTIWQYRGGESDFTPETLQAAGGSPLLARLLYNRGIRTPEDIEAFLNLENYQPTSGWELPDAEAGIARIIQAIQEKQHILVYGDFDVDGITGTSILYEGLKRVGASVSYYIPDRATEGHGLHSPALIRLTSTRQVKLVISTDTGITNFAEVSLLNGLGVDTVITDHHALPENLPPAVANVNPQRLPADHPFHPMCGAGVAYKVCELLFHKLLPSEEAEVTAERLLDLTAVGTVVDMVPLRRENRYLVWRGLQVLNRRERLGIQEILAQAGTAPEAKLTSETLGFTIGPRLNALGRLDRADQAVELLTTDDPVKARPIAAHLEQLNRRRREMTEKTFLEAEQYLGQHGGLGDNRCICLGSPEWNHGIIGLVASRLIEKYHVPVFLMVIDESKGEARCSARSIPGFNLIGEISTLSHYFTHYGGHAGAGGFALKLQDLEAFKRDLYALTAARISDEQMLPLIDVDTRLQWSQINPYLVEMLSKLQPCGMANPAPKFVLESVKVAAQRALGEDGRHLKLILTENGKTDQPLEGLIWNHGAGGKFDASVRWSFVVVPELNTYNGNTKVQLIIEDYQSPDDAKLSTQVTREANKIQLKPTASPDLRVSSPVHSVSMLEEADNTEASGARWVDHRSRDGVESFVGQLMIPLQDSRKVLIYHEGSRPDIPFVQEELLCTRFQVKPAEELIFWDLPPTAEDFRRILDWVKPEVVHLIGGKYQSVPVFPPEQHYLKVILQTLRKQAANNDNGSASIQPDLFAATLATTTPVILSGLILLENVGLLEAEVLSSQPKTEVRVKISQTAGVQEMNAQSLPFLLFREYLAQVGGFRNWLLSEPLDKIKQTLPMASTVTNQKEQGAYAHVTNA